MKKYVFISILVIVVLAVILKNGYIHENTRLELMSGDTLPSSIKFFNTTGGANRITDIKGKYKVIFYLDSTNDDCMKRLDCISKVIHLISLEDISYVILWTDGIPVEKIKEAGIDPKYLYSLAGKVTLSESKPNAFLADTDNKIITVTGYSYISLINTLIELGGKKELSARAVEMILKNTSRSDAFLPKNNEKTLLMFMSSSCRMCRKAEDIVQKNIGAMQKKINVITVRPDFDIKQNYDKIFESDPQQVYFNIFAYAQDIKADFRKYPMFVIIDNAHSIEKVFTHTDEAVKYTLGL